MTPAELTASAPNDYLATLLQLGQTLNSTLELHQVLETAIEQVIDFVGAERGFILLVDIESGRVWGEAVRGIDRSGLEATLSGAADTATAEISRTLVENVLDTRQSVISFNAMEDPRFAGRQSVQFHNLRSVLCVPLLAQSRLLGVIYVDNRLISGLFTDGHLAMLAAFANQAAVAIENARLYENLRRSLEERLHLQDELHRQETQRLALEEANRLKTSFVGFVAHELRNPLTAIRGYVQTLIADPDLDEATRQEFLESIEIDSDRLLDMINELLDMSRLEAGYRLSLSVQPVSVRRAIERIAERHKFFKHYSLKHNLIFEFAPDLPEFITADESKLHQIFYNLLSNATKYSPDGGDIVISAGPDGPDRVIIRFIDHGVGMTQEQCSRLFQPYERADREAIRNIPGTGIGLYLVKNLVELHGGTISVESDPGHGSIFTVRLPITPVTEETAGTPRP